MSMITPPGAAAADRTRGIPGALTEAEAAELDLAAPAKPRSLLRRGWEVFAENRLALASLGILVFVIGFCFVGPLIYHTDQVHTNLADYLCHPGASHPLGCDNVGYDELGRLMAGGQTSLEVGLAAAFVSVALGVSTGPSPGSSAGRQMRS